MEYWRNGRMGNLFCNRVPGLVSVVIAAYNRANYIKETLDSIKNQTYQNIEVIIVDDCSTDNTAEVIAKWRQDNPQTFESLLYFKLPRNRDEEWAYNIGFCMTRGEFIAQQNSDDLSHKERIWKQVEHLVKNKEVAAVGTGFYVCIENMEHLLDTSSWLSYDREEIERNYKNNFHCVCTGTILFRAAMLEEVIGYRKTRYGDNDVELLCYIVKHEFILDNIKEVLFYYREHPEQKGMQIKKEEGYIDKKMVQIKGRVSVLLPVYRDCGHILNSLESILEQTYKDIEIIIVDDLLDEGLEENIKKCFADYKEMNPDGMTRELIYFKLPRRVGYPWIYNIGAYLSMGEYIVWHGDNGTSEKNKIEKQAEFLSNNFVYMAVGTNYRPEHIPIKYDHDIVHSCVIEYEPCVNMNTVMLRADIINMTAGMNQSMSGREDFEFMQRLIRTNNQVQNIRDVLYYENN
jgi:glycosyltransferase involved in cell wall biosynthesis